MNLRPESVVKAVRSIRGTISTVYSNSLDSKSNASDEVCSVATLRKQEQSGLCVILVQVSVIALFLACIAGAFYYAIQSSEAEYQIEHMSWNPSSNYSSFFSQFASEGRFTITLSQAASMKELTLSFNTHWYQNDDTKHIVHKVDNFTVAYVLPEVTFWVKLNESHSPIGCSEEKNGGYFNYIESLGLFSMEDRHSEFSRMRDGKSSYVFDSYPPSNPLFHEHGFKRGEALLVQSFVDSRTGTVLGWQTYFALTTEAEKGLRRTEYWFPEMRRAARRDSL